MNEMTPGEVCARITCAAVVFSAAMLATAANAQDSVTVDLGAISSAVPQLLVPGESPPPVKLRPPPGIKLVKSDGGAVKLRPPLSMVKRTMPAPETTVAAVPKPKEAASPPKAAPAPTAATKPKPTQTTEPAPITPQAKPAEDEVAATEEMETAALVQPEKTPPPPDEFTIPYGVGDAGVPEHADDNLRLLAARMAKNADLRVEFIAYASDAEGDVSRSRRLSLERAVNMRKMLLDASVDSSRVNLRALGRQSGGGNPDRIDVIVTTR